MASTLPQQPLPQPQQQQQQQQPVLVYPNTVARDPHQSDSHSSGNFGTVFIVLAVIIVVSGLACCLGRLCNKQALSKDRKKDKSSKKSKNQHNSKVGQGDDIEFGLPPPTFGRPMAGEREGPIGPHQKQPGEMNNGPYNPYAPSPSQQQHNHHHRKDEQEDRHGGGVNMMKMMNGGQQKKGFGNGGKYDHRGSGTNFPVVEFQEEEVRPSIKIRDRQAR